VLHLPLPLLPSLLLPISRISHLILRPPLSLSLRITQAHLHRPLRLHSVSIHKVHVFFVSEKSSESAMVDKFMTGALYEACYVV